MKRHVMGLAAMVVGLAGCTHEPAASPGLAGGPGAAPAASASAAGPAAPAADGLFRWRPLRLGAGGFVTGFITHPLDAGVRYCRTDVGNAYRWQGDEWVPMVVGSATSGMPAALSAVPTANGVEALGLDPSDPRTVYLAMAGKRSPDVGPAFHSVSGSVYKSVDGGRSFSGSDLSVRMDANGAWRTEGERLQVDPRNSAVVYFGSVGDGLWRSLDGGRHWTAVRGNGAPAATNNILKILFSPADGTTNLGDMKVSRVLYAVGARDTVYGSEDGGAAWRDLGAGQPLAGKTKHAEIDAAGTLYVGAVQSRDIWRYRQGAWTKLRPAALNNDLNGFAVDPARPQCLYAIGRDASTSRSLDGGATWTAFGPLGFANTFGWLPQPVEGWRSNAGIAIDRDGTLWIPQGNEGMLRWRPPADAADTNRPRWTIESRGIEELVAHDVVIPPGGPIVVAVEDATGMVITDPDRFTARQIGLQDQLISNGTGLSYCPDAPEYLAIVTTDINHTRSGVTYSGCSGDGGRTWTRFAGYPHGADGKPLHPAGSIAISRRGGWGAGSDHLVWLPTGKNPPFYSHDGGRSWQAGEGFPADNGYWIFALKQRQLVADPFTPDRFYAQGTWRGGFYVSADGGRTWQLQGQAGLPVNTHNGHLAANPRVKDDLWFVDGWQGASQHGVWHSTNGGQAFERVAAFDHGLTLCLGAGRGQRGDAPYCVYVYGKQGAAEWGVFRSADAGRSWDRVAFYPAGIFDQPTCMAASWDRYGLVVVGFAGNSYVVGSP